MHNGRCTLSPVEYVSVFAVLHPITDCGTSPNPISKPKVLGSISIVTHLVAMSNFLKIHNMKVSRIEFNPTCSGAKDFDTGNFESLSVENSIAIFRGNDPPFVSSFTLPHRLIISEAM